MKLSPASLLILTMFCSFAVILTAMILLFRPDPGLVRRRAGRIQTSKTPPVKQRAGPDSGLRTALKSQVSDTGHVSSGGAVAPSSPSPQQAAEAQKQKAPAPFQSWMPAPGSRLQKRLEQEQKEKRMLRNKMENLLKEQLAIREQKLARLARACEELEPGEAVQILQALDDETIAGVLRRLKPEPAGKIAALLKRLDRKAAVPSQYQ